MSLSIDLKKIKSSGIYRFVYDKSTLPPSEAETIRLFVGYSNKGPFNTPVYIDNTADFETVFGKASKKLERKGIFFHRLCNEAIPAGPILALNLKPFAEEKVSYISGNAKTIATSTPSETGIKVVDLYDTNRFWVLDPDSLPKKVTGQPYITIAASDTKENSCSLFIRKAPADSVKGYDLTFREWYNASGDECPDYIREYLMEEKVADYFLEVYIFRGQFTKELCGEGGVLAKYFDVNEDTVTLKTTITNGFNENVDALYALAEDANSNYVASYVGSTLPYWKDASGNYASLDILINQDQPTHKLIAKLDDTLLDAAASADALKGYINPVSSSLETSSSKSTGIAPRYITGYTYDSSKVTIDSCLGVLTGATSKGLREALTNHVDSEWHYLVDTFGCTSLDLTKSYKEVLSNLVKAKDNALGLINFPAMSLFANDETKRFVNTTTSKFDISLIPTKFKLPGDTAGASWVGYFTPYVVSDGTVKTIVPSAGAISNNFITKWSQRQPYYVVAGPIYGQVTASGLVGPDYNYSRADLDVLEPYGVNALVYHPRFGTYINSNQTAKQTPVSALSKLHIRELVIFLQNEIETMLRGYQWELNTPSLRSTIKTKADTLLENVRANGGVYDFLCICDESNNTPETIDAELIILDVNIEPARAAGKMVQRLYIYKTGQIASLGV